MPLIRGKICEKVNLRQIDPIMQIPFEELLNEARQKDVPWILAVYGCLSQEGKKRLRYADALGLQGWRKVNNTDPQTREAIIYSDYYRLEYVDDNLEVTYLGATNKAVVDKKTLLGLLLTYPRMRGKREQADHCSELARMFNKYEKDDERAIKWYKKSINKGKNDIAMNNLGNLYEKLGNYEYAIKYYEEAAKSGDVKVMSYLGYLYEQLGNYEYAMKWCEKAAKSGSPQAEHNLGRLLKEYREHNNLVFRSLIL